MNLKDCRLFINGKEFVVTDLRIDFREEGVRASVDGFLPEITGVYNHQGDSRCNRRVCFEENHNSGGAIEAMKKLTKAMQGEDMNKPELQEVPEKVAKFVNDNYKAFYRLGWVDENLELTDIGRRGLGNFLLDQNEDAFGKHAQELVSKLEKEEEGKSK